MEKMIDTTFYIPVSAFIDDINRIKIKGATNKVTRKMRSRVFYMISAFWVLYTTDYIPLRKDKNGAWLPKVISNALGHDFDSVFEKLQLRNGKRYVKNFGIQSLRLNNRVLRKNKYYYSIKSFAHPRSLLCEAVSEGSEMYEEIKKIIERVENNLKKSYEANKKYLNENEREFSDRYIELFFDNASMEDLEREYGITLSEAKELDAKMKQESCVITDYAQYTNAKKLLQEYSNFTSFNSNFYNVSFKFGRLYTPLHNASKKLRKHLRNKNGEQMIEVYDMHGAHLVGFFVQCACVARKQGNSKLADSFMNYVENIEEDPYRFALQGGFEDKRDTVKLGVLSYIFASYSDCRYRGLFINRMKDSDSYSDVFNFCEEFSSIYDKYSYCAYTLSKDVLLSVFNDLTYNSKISYVLTGENYKKISFYNANSYKTIGSEAGRKDLRKGCVDLKAFDSVVDVSYKAMLQYHVEQCLIKEFGADALYVCTKVKKQFYDKTNAIVDSIVEDILKTNPKAKRVSRRELARGNTPNASVVCQIAEGKTMFESIVPELVKDTGCNEIVTLHDAIFVPESIVSKIDVKELNFKVMSAYIANVEYTFEHIDEYFSCYLNASLSTTD